MIHPHRQFLSLIVALTSLSSVPALARHAPLHWEKIHVSRILPSTIFTKLGLTHITKNGHTRDGKQGVADPAFPPGLTDVVPYDTDHLLLVRGTTDGLNLFRSRVAAADVPAPVLHLKVEMSPRAGEANPAVYEQDNIQDTVPSQISLGTGDAQRVYLITTRANADGTFWIACRTSLPLPGPLPAPADTSPAPAAVFVPARVWTEPLTGKVKLGETAIFEDRAVDRQAANRKLGITGVDSDMDYTLHVTLTAMPAPALAAPTTAP